MPLTSQKELKGKQRAYQGPFSTQRRDSTGSGGGNGIVVPLQYVGTTAYNAAYTLPILVGSNNLNVSLQVDTGSSDLWVTASSCATSSCSNVPGSQKYNPSSSSSSVESSAIFNITYVEGGASGPIVWDMVNVGSYIINTQAFAAASTVVSEPLSNSFDGVLGLGLPDNSIISQLIPSTSSSTTDGSQFVSNLFSLTPSTLSPAARFLSLTLERPGSSTIPSLFGIGSHPSQSQVAQIGNGENVQYSTPLASLASASVSNLYWKASIEDITVWVDAQPKTISLQKSSFENNPSAVLDTGAPIILSTKAIADAIYGAIGVSPASDGNYYVDCKTPLNLTITLDNRKPISVHPLDLTTESSSAHSSSSCVGLIQAADSSLSGIADMILGVPFIRNTYMVLAYEVPNSSNGSFPDLRPSSDPQSPADTAISDELVFRLGLQGLTNATVAMQEFQNVRDLGEPLDGAQPVSSESKKSLNVGLDVLFGLIGFFGLCFVLFGIRFCVMKRKYRGTGPSPNANGSALRSFEDSPASTAADGGLFGWFRSKKSTHDPYIRDQKDLGAYQLAGRHSLTTDTLPSEDALRQMRYKSYLQRERLASEYTINSEHTRIGDLEDVADGEFGLKKKADGKSTPPRDITIGSLSRDIDWDPAKDLDWNRETLVGLDSSMHYKDMSWSSARDRSLSPEQRPMMLQLGSKEAGGSRSSRVEPLSDSPGHGRGPSITHPLLQLPETALIYDNNTPQSLPATPEHDSSRSDLDLDQGEFGEFGGMAGVGSARRNKRLHSESLDMNIRPISTIEPPPSSHSTRS
ncbi:aspartic peptidase domain-containing protein [Rhodocollybia butyracea]|uniref:Aspartic peptidase domain-containing protein n=1 Tax=Rhodocollybia butyracea TaxID=206335 RepID=A0A9P5Q1G6_9AGAR|nr:aspartic peptidase domain-containing protein [Rhodocollybia butyracea]